MHCIHDAEYCRRVLPGDPFMEEKMRDILSAVIA